MSRWGKFLTSIESGLDNILSEDDDKSKGTDSGRSTPAPAPSSAAPSQRPSQEISRQASTRRRNDRLQERLARAIDGKKEAEAKRKEEESRGVGEDENDRSLTVGEEAVPSNGEPKGGEAGSRLSTDREMLELTAEGTQSPHFVELEVARADEAATESTTSATEAATEKDQLGRRSEEPTATSPIETDNERVSMGESSTSTDIDGANDFYLERIDALQAKLKYLVEEATQAARKAAAESKADSAERKLAQKEEKIALLMQEGQMLSRTELKHLSTIKQLQSRVKDDEKSLAAERRATSDARKEVLSFKGKWSEAESAKAQGPQQSQKISKLEQELEKERGESRRQASEVAKLRDEIRNSRASELLASIEEQKRLLQVERNAVADLRDDLSTARVEKELAQDRQKMHLEQEKLRADRAKELHKNAEDDLRREIMALEARLETLRAHSEEVLGGPADLQAKHLRQIETLQRQYSVASENWRGIETSLSTKIPLLERERDDLTRKEAELRRKLRENSSRLRSMQDQVDEAMTKSSKVEDDLLTEQGRIAELRAALVAARQEAETAKMGLKAAQEEAASAWAENSKNLDRMDSPDLPTPRSRAQSPALMTPRHGHGPNGSDLRSHRQHSTAGLGRLYGKVSQVERQGPRKLSLQHSQAPVRTPTHQDSVASFTRISSHQNMHDSRSVSIDEEDDHLMGLATPATPGRTLGDMISASTPSAGPSVQLVERMSSAVRRLESEKTATKDELDRLSQQRDEAREEIMSLMAEIEEKRGLDAKVSQLQSQVEEMSEKYETTLDLLGEKSEMVDELRADIDDMKEIYRENLQKSLR